MNRVLLLGALTGACLLAACGGGDDAASTPDTTATTTTATATATSSTRVNAGAMATATPSPAIDLPRAEAPADEASDDDSSVSMAASATTAMTRLSAMSAMSPAGSPLSSDDAAQLLAIRQVRAQVAANGVPGTLALTWKPSSGATSYRVYFGTASRAYLQPLGGGVPSAVPALSLTGLVSGTTYHFSVTCVDASGKETAYSDEMTQVVS